MNTQTTIHRVNNQRKNNHSFLLPTISTNMAQNDDMPDNICELDDDDDDSNESIKMFKTN